MLWLFSGEVLTRDPVFSFLFSFSFINIGFFFCWALFVFSSSCSFGVVVLISSLSLLLRFIFSMFESMEVVVDVCVVSVGWVSVGWMNLLRRVVFDVMLGVSGDAVGLLFLFAVVVVEEEKSVCFDGVCLSDVGVDEGCRVFAEYDGDEVDIDDADEEDVEVGVGFFGVVEVDDIVLGGGYLWWWCWFVVLFLLFVFHFHHYLLYNRVVMSL